MTDGGRRAGPDRAEATDGYDLIFVGNVGLNVIHRFDGSTDPMVGGPVFFGALSTTWSDKRVAVVTRMAHRDRGILEPLCEADIDVFVSPTRETTRGHMYYLSDDVDDRRHTLETSAGPFSMTDLPPVGARLFHLVGVNRLEFPLDFMIGVRDRGQAFTVDMQALIRRTDLRTGEVRYEDYPHKRRVAAMAAKVKLDAVEAEILTGTADLEQAALQFERWGTPEVMITRSDGVLVRHERKSYFEPFTHRWVSGRTGRGDTTFGSYLARRLDFGVPESLKFAAAAASMKLERPGFLSVTRDEVVQRMSGSRQG
ncbi:MAG: PfkB family carbohydrate kinase [bacterium]